MNKNTIGKSRIERHRRVRAKISGTGKRPRLSVFRSLKGIYAQIIDDTEGKTLASAKLSDVPAKARKNNIAGAREVGKIIAAKCVKIKLTSVLFDRGGYKYDGKVKALAEGAREGGLKF